MERARAEVALPGPGRCPYCRDPIADARQLVACAACGARHHAACRKEHGACASCGATELLVRSAPTSAARLRRERPPKGSRIQVEVADDGERITYRWPRFRSKRALYAIVAFFLVTVFLFPLGLLLWRELRKDEPTEVTLEPDRIALGGIQTAWGRKSFEGPREEVGAVGLDRKYGHLRVTLDLGVERLQVANTENLSEPELEWLREALLAWKEQA